MFYKERGRKLDENSSEEIYLYITQIIAMKSLEFAVVCEDIYAIWIIEH